MIGKMFSREVTNYEDHSSKFLLRSFDYNKQYSHFYAHRLAEMSRLVAQRAKEHWGEEYTVKKLCELREERIDSCVIIGTIYKHQAHKPSILREISEENQLAPQPPREHYADLEDKVILEDELQRVRLYGKIDARYMASGVVCAVLGSIEEDGRFDVEEMLFYESGPQRPLSQNRPGGEKLVFISGLDQSQVHNYADALNLFQHWLCGNIPSKREHKQFVRLVVAGNSVRSTAEQRSTALLQTRNSDSNVAVEALRALDSWFAAISQSIAVDVMPGAHDPANFMLPQQPFHRCMFPEAARYTTFRSVPNPYAFTLNQSLVVGTSGQNVDDLLRSTMLDEPLEALRKTLIWSHIAPTAPDTLACYPYIDTDPFILRNCPHIYFAGNSNKFATDLHVGTGGQRTRLICIPSFATSQTIAVVDVETLECQEMCFTTKHEMLQH